MSVDGPLALVGVTATTQASARRTVSSTGNLTLRIVASGLSEEATVRGGCDYLNARAMK
jgi:hypothetical protein